MKTIINIAIALFILSVAVLPAPTEGKTLYNLDWCDKMYLEMFLQDVPSTIQKECGNRFIYLTNVQKSYFRNH